MGGSHNAQTDPLLGSQCEAARTMFKKCFSLSLGIQPQHLPFAGKSASFCWMRYSIHSDGSWSEGRGESGKKRRTEGRDSAGEGKGEGGQEAEGSLLNC